MNEPTKYTNMERRSSQCGTHEAMITLLAKIDKKLEVVSAEIRWHNGIGKKFFIVGVALLGVGLSSLVYFGKLDQRVTTLERQMNLTMDHLRVSGLHYTPPRLGREAP